MTDMTVDEMKGKIAELAASNAKLNDENVSLKRQVAVLQQDVTTLTTKVKDYCSKCKAEIKEQDVRFCNQCYAAEMARSESLRKENTRKQGIIDGAMDHMGKNGLKFSFQK